MTSGYQACTCFFHAELYYFDLVQTTLEIHVGFLPLDSMLSSRANNMDSLRVTKTRIASRVTQAHSLRYCVLLETESP